MFAESIAIEEIEYLSRYTGAKPVRIMNDLKKSDILGRADHIYEDEDNGVIYIDNVTRKYGYNDCFWDYQGNISERWRAVIWGKCSRRALNKGVVAGGGAAESHVIEKVKNLRLKGLEQVGLDVVTSALESIMRQILTNAGYNGLEKAMGGKSLS